MDITDNYLVATSYDTIIDSIYLGEYKLSGEKPLIGYPIIKNLSKIQSAHYENKCIFQSITLNTNAINIQGYVIDIFRSLDSIISLINTKESSMVIFDEDGVATKLDVYYGYTSTMQITPFGYTGQHVINQDDLDKLHSVKKNINL